MLKNISGFPEFLPCQQIAFNDVLKIIKDTFELYGFAPLDTSAVEKVSTLLAKGNDNEIYGLYRLADKDGDGKKDLALRFDLTVPLSRYMAQNYGYLTLPYRRYQIAPVWRGERPQAGRYRQFYQCDIDIIGDGELGLIYDAELLSVIHDVFKAIGLTCFVIKINNRNILNGIIKSFGISKDNIADILRIIDKAEKISKSVLVEELELQGLSANHIATLLNLISLRLPNDDCIAYLRALSNSEESRRGLEELVQVLHDARNFGVPDCHMQIVPGLARGLSYYTGTVYETILTDCPELGSICGGGRYADLASTFTNKKLPGVGISIGISRLIPKLIEMGVIKADSNTPADVLVTTQNTKLMQHYIKLAQILRGQGIKTEIYLQDKPLGMQMKYAAKKGFRFVIIADTAEFESESAILRNMDTGEQTKVFITDIKIPICK